MGKTEENDKSKLELKSASKPGGPFEIHSLNNFREVGNYTWIAREITDEMGFPNCVKDTDDCHYCEGQLFVMRHGAKKTSQSTDTFGQVLTIINHETGATNIYTRAVHPLDSDEWKPWQMVATGDPKLITENNDINKVLSTSEKFNQIVRALYIPPQNLNISDVSFVRIYKGFAGLYGLRFYSKDSTVLYSITDNKMSNIIENLDGVLVIDYNKIEEEYIDVRNIELYEIIHYPELQPLILSQKNANQLSGLSSKVSNIETINKIFERTDLYIATSNTWVAGGKTIFIPCEGKQIFQIETRDQTSVFAFLKSNTASKGESVDYATDTTRTVVAKYSSVTTSIPQDAKFICIIDCVGETSWMPVKIIIDGINYAQNSIDELSGRISNIERLFGDYHPQIVDGFILTNDVWGATGKGFFVYCKGKNSINIKSANNTAICAFVTSKVFSIGEIVDYATDAKRTIILEGKEVSLTVPSDANYLWVSYSVGEASWMPSEIYIDTEAYLTSFARTIPQLDNIVENLKDTIHTRKFFDNIKLSPNKSRLNSNKPYIYFGDNKSNGNYLVNVVIYPSGVIIGARDGGSIVRIGLDGTETTLLSIEGASDWRLLWMDSNLNVYASPHASISSMDTAGRGLYKLAYGENSFVKVIELYNPDSDIPSETEDNDDTIWTMCEDAEGYLYAGVYSHTKHNNPAIYKSIDGGDTWFYHYNFVNSGLASSGKHIHAIIHNEYDNALYCIVGEINTLYKSTDGATTWVDAEAPCEYYKGSAMIATPTGILIGSDGAYNCAVAKYYPDGKVETKGVASANTIFAFRRSDISNTIYAFCKIDSSVNTLTYYPPIEAINNVERLNEWKNSASEKTLLNWNTYNELTNKIYPEDAIRPQHFMIMASNNEGESWSVVYREFTGSYGASGCWTTGYFRNGECLSGRILRTQQGFKVANPIIISDGKHRYNAEGIDLSGDILYKL